VREVRATAGLRRSEELHRVTFDQAAVGITYNRMDGSYIDANRAYCQMMGYSREQLLAMKYMDLLHPEDAARHASVKPGEKFAVHSTLSLQHRHVRKDGQVIWTAVEVALVRHQDGRPDFSVAIVQDITERKRARAELQEQLEELRRFRRVAVDRELRMQEVEEENRRLKQEMHA
jgi:PAS domain S-box-containing protein